MSVRWTHRMGRLGVKDDGRKAVDDGGRAEITPREYTVEARHSVIHESRVIWTTAASQNERATTTRMRVLRIRRRHARHVHIHDWICQVELL